MAKTASIYKAPDTLQLFLLGVCLFDLGFFSFYLFTHELQWQNTISDTLFDHPEYAAILTSSLAVRMLGIALYLSRFRYEGGPVYGWLIAGFLGVFFTLFGW